MRLLPLALLVTTAIAVPFEYVVDLEPRQIGGKGKGGKGGASKGGGGVSAGGGRERVHFIFARGSTEAGTMGSTVGPALSSSLGRKFGSVKTEGVPYPADIAGAFSGGTNPKGAKGSIKMAAMAKN